MKNVAETEFIDEQLALAERLIEFITKSKKDRKAKEPYYTADVLMLALAVLFKTCWEDNWEDKEECLAEFSKSMTKNFRAAVNNIEKGTIQ